MLSACCQNNKRCSCSCTTREKGLIYFEALFLPGLMWEWPPSMSWLLIIEAPLQFSSTQPSYCNFILLVYFAHFFTQTKASGTPARKKSKHGKPGRPPNKLKNKAAPQASPGKENLVRKLTY